MIWVIFCLHCHIADNRGNVIDQTDSIVGGSYADRAACETMLDAGNFAVLNNVRFSFRRAGAFCQQRKVK